MPSYVMGQDPLVGEIASSAQLAQAIRATDFSGGRATVIGYGNMGRQFVNALRALGIRRIRVCSHPTGDLKSLENDSSVETVVGEFEDLDCRPTPEETGIIATPAPLLVPAARRLASLGFRRLLIEKPVSLWSTQIQRLSEYLDRQGVEAVCGYNRIAYPSFHEVRSRTDAEGGITSCTYNVTELIKPDWTQRFSSDDLCRWGVSNSLHLVGMAHGLIGPPKSWSSHRSGVLDWHPTGSVFVGSGMSSRDIPFAYHADWGSKGRWSVEVHTAVSTYRLCPIEEVMRKTEALGEWEQVPLTAFAPGVKPGIAEEVAALLSPGIRRLVPLISLTEAANLTRFGEDVFGYPVNSD